MLWCKSCQINVTKRHLAYFLRHAEPKRVLVNMSEKEMDFIFCYVTTGIHPDSLVLVSGNKLLHMAFLFIVYRPKEYLRAIHDLSLTI